MVHDLTTESTATLTPEQLAQAFEAFERASATMTVHYERLQQRVADLNLELESKNRELSHSLSEREAMNRYLESLLENLTNGVIALTGDGRIATINRAAEEMLHTDRQSMIDRFIGEIVPALADCLRPLDGGAVDFDRVSEVVIEPADPTADGACVLEVQVRPTPNLMDQRDGHLLIMRDVTELRRLARAANLCNRLTAMGEMAMNVAHEVRNPLGSIELFASALRQELCDDTEQQRLVDYISQGVRSIDNIVNNILMFARQIDPSLENVNPAALLDDVLTYGRLHMAQKEIVLCRRDNADRACCLADGELLKQVFLNLLLNAVQAMDTGGTLTLESRATADQVIFLIGDDGPGMAPQTLSRIFDPFFTTRRRGTGLGLTICHNIIQAHQGCIDVRSAPGEGTVFTIQIPRA